MRDLEFDELSNVYGGGSKGRGCSPQPPSCGGGSKSRKSKKSKKAKKSRKSRKSGKYC